MLDLLVILPNIKISYSSYSIINKIVFIYPLKEKLVSIDMTI